MSTTETATEVAESTTTTVEKYTAKPEHVQLVEVLYGKLRNTLESVLNDEGVSAGNIIMIIDTAMKLVGKMKDLDGQAKKAVVITVVKKLIEESSLKESDEEVIKIIAERALDPAIDQLFAMAPEVYGKVKQRCSLFCARVC